jgi:trehalose-6-phosphate synthase
MSPDERQSRSKALKTAIQNDDITRWLETQLIDLKAAAEKAP